MLEGGEKKRRWKTKKKKINFSMTKKKLHDTKEILLILLLMKEL